MSDDIGDVMAHIIRERQYDTEALRVQFDGILKSVAAGRFASARAELNGARFILDGIERRRLTR